MSWSISRDGEVLLKSSGKTGVTGAMADGYRGQLMTTPAVRLSPVGPTIQMPPQNEVESFLVAFVYLRDSLDGAKLNYKAPAGVDKYLGPQDGRVY